MDNVRVITIDTNPAQTSVKELRTELKSLKDTLVSTEQGTEEYNQALARSAEITHILKEQTEEINASAMDFGQIAGNCTKAVGGLVAGFQAAKATMNLFGIENEAVLESLQKMQNLMAITQALPSIDNGIKGFKRLRLAIQGATAGMSGLKKALISSGIGALVVVLGVIIANFDKISAWLDEITGQTDFLGDLSDKVIGGLNAGWAAIVQSLKAVGNALITYVTTPFKAVWNAIQAYTSTNGGFADKLKAAGKAMKDGFVSDWKKVGDDFKEVGTVAAAAYQSGYEKHKAKRLAKDVEDAVDAGKKEGEAKGKAKADAEEAAYKKRLKQIDTQERAEMLALQKLGLNYETYVAKKQELEDKFTQKRIEALKNILETEVGLTEEEIAALQDELIKLQDSLYKKPEKTKETTEDENVSTAKQLSEAINASALALNDFSNKPAWGNILKNVATLAANWDALQENIKKGGKEAFTSYTQIAATAFSAVAQMMNGLASEQDTSNKEGFEASKKYQVAGATMSMLAGIASAWASSMQLMFPANVIVGTLLSAMMLGTGIAQIQKIKNTQFGGSGSTSSASAPNANAISSMIAPVQYTQDVQGGSIEDALKDTKVYVTETDISNTQNKVKVTESEAKF